MKQNRKRAGPAGQTLIQALVGIGVSAIVISALLAATVSMQKSNKQLSQKLEVLDVKNQLMAAFLNPTNCTCQLNPTMNSGNASNLKFNSTATNAEMNLRELKTSCNPSSAPLVKADEFISGTQTKLKVKSVRLQEIQPTGNVEEYQGKVVVDFDESSLAGALAPLKFSVKFYGDPTSAPTQKTALSCLSDSGVRVASGADTLGTNNLGNVTIDLSTYGFDPAGADPHIIVSERNYNYDHVEGNTMDASYCGYVRDSKLVFTVTCWASTNSSAGTVRSSFDWIALQR